MFRDLKEYQDIAKIYADKVSKPENLEERRGTELSKDQIQKNREGLKNRIMYGNPEGKKPVITSQSNRQKLTQQRQKQNKGRVEKQFGFLKTKPSSEFQGRKSRSSQNMQGKPKPEPEYKPEKGVVFGQRTNEVGAQGGGKPSEGDFKKDFPDKNKKPKMGSPDSKFIKKDKGVGFVKRGTPGAQRAENKEKNKMRAQEMAKAKIAAKKEGTASTPMSGKEKAQAMAKARLAKKAEMANEEFTPYDIVLEYLLSTEQAATIEEANYVMTEMDAETIQGIVEEQKKNFDEGAGVAAAALAGGLLTYGLYKRNQYKKDAENRDEKTNFGKIQKATDEKNKLLKSAGMGGN